MTSTLSVQSVVATAPVEEDVSGSGTSAFLRAVWRLTWPTLVALGLVLVLWIGLLKAFSISPLVGKPPQDVVKYLFTDSGASANRSAVWSQLQTTLKDASTGFVAGLLAAMVVAGLFVLFRAVEQAFMPIAMLLRSVPLVAMTPIILLVFGRDFTGVAVISGIVVFFPALVTIVFGLRSTSQQATDLVMAYGGSRLTVLLKVGLPTALPAVFAAARISVPGSLVGALIAEWLATGKGVGGGILNAIGAFDYGLVWASIVVLTLVSLVLYTVVGVLETAVLSRFGPDPARR